MEWSLAGSGVSNTHWCSVGLPDRFFICSLSDSQDGWTPLHYATHSGNTDTAKVLVEAGVNLHIKGNVRIPSTPLALLVPCTECR